jgi:23S rRNA (adenine2503-C2)-methyltransferase
MQGSKKDIRGMTEEELKQFFLGQGEKAFHGKQVYEWLWKKGATRFEVMSNLSKSSRTLLEEHFDIPSLEPAGEQSSRDGTLKMVFKTVDNELIESVLIPTKSRATACISSQVGCKLACTFCATGKIPFRRNLTAGEIFDQVLAVRQKAQERLNLSLSNIVYMGMGEPLLNYEQVAASVRVLCSEKGLGISPRRITVSTVGIPEAIRKLADSDLRTELAVSLHSAIDATRSRLAPINKKYDLQTLRKALVHFHQKTGKRITFEYLLLKDVNDQIDDARALAEYSKSFPVKINLIEYNEVEGSGFHKPDNQRLEAFKAFLEERNMVVNVRRSRGEDIDAACGQLAGKRKK